MPLPFEYVNGFDLRLDGATPTSAFHEEVLVPSDPDPTSATIGTIGFEVQMINQTTGAHAFFEVHRRFKRLLGQPIEFIGETFDGAEPVRGEGMEGVDVKIESLNGEHIDVTCVGRPNETIFVGFTVLTNRAWQLPQPM